MTYKHFESWRRLSILSALTNRKQLVRQSQQLVEERQIQKKLKEQEFEQHLLQNHLQQQHEEEQIMLQHKQKKIFPITGKEISDLGISITEIKRELRYLQEKWIKSNFELTKQNLIKMLKQENDK